MANSQPQESKIQIRDTFAGAEYANAMSVQHGKEEFLITFINVAGPAGRVVSKIITSPGHLKRIMSALEDNIKKYESSFGPITEAQSPTKEIGFQAPAEDSN